jgi:hypothetical protein
MATRDPPPPTHGSQTITATPTPGEPEAGPSNFGVLRLRGAAPANAPRVQWTSDVVDNEGLNKKKSKSAAQTALPDRFSFVAQSAASTTSHGGSTSPARTSQRTTRTTRQRTVTSSHRRLTAADTSTIPRSGGARLHRRQLYGMRAETSPCSRRSRRTSMSISRRTTRVRCVILSLQALMLGQGRPRAASDVHGRRGAGRRLAVYPCKLYDYGRACKRMSH